MSRAEGKFPRPARDGRSVFWFEHEIDEYLEQLAAERDRLAAEHERLAAVRESQQKVV